MFNKKGRCNIHGEGADRVYVPRMVTTVGAGGKKVTQLVKKWIWRCDLTEGGGSKLKQPSISKFLKTTFKKTAGSDDSGQQQQQGGVASVSDASVGQSSGCVLSKPSTDVTAERFGADDRK